MNSTSTLPSGSGGSKATPKNAFQPFSHNTNRSAKPPPSPPTPSPLSTPASHSSHYLPISSFGLDDPSPYFGKGAAPSLMLSPPPTASMPTTQPYSDTSGRGRSSTRIGGALHVLRTEAEAVAAVAELYATHALAQSGFDRAISAMTQSVARGGKVVIIGVGKSGHIGRKLVATMNSVGVSAALLHATEALHGDLGLLSPLDTVIWITFSGNTPELLALLPHVNPAIAQCILTSHRHPGACEMLRRRPELILLPAPTPEPEARVLGVAAPTASTAVALAVGDALAMVASRELYSSSVAEVFARNHPGGAIGAAQLAVPPHPSPVAAPTTAATATATAYDGDDAAALSGSLCTQSGGSSCTSDATEVCDQAELQSTPLSTAPSTPPPRLATANPERIKS